MIAVLIAQFLSALADNMLLFIILGLIKQHGAPDWAMPVLQQTFLIAYIVLAPFVGAVADNFAKNRVMLLSNTLKFLAVVFLLSGGSPYLAYGLVGVGACIYSPAKYGILKEIKGEAFLVKANAMIEGSTIVAILVGVVLGGFLADIAVVKGNFTSIITWVAGIYLMASVCNLFIQKLQPEHSNKIQPLTLFNQFFNDLKTLLSDLNARISLIGTALFFGVGATLRIWILAWVPKALAINDNETPAMLNAVVAVGVVMGSGLASRIPLSQAHRVISAGVGMGVGTMLLSLTNNLTLAYVWLLLTGVCGGLFLVPLNALLQKQGHDLIGGGHAIAIQNFIENVTMLVMLMFYQLLVATDMSVINLGLVFGALVVGMMLWLQCYAWQHNEH